MREYRGMGHTTLMVLNLPTTGCVILVPSIGVQKDVERILRIKRPDVERCTIKIVADRGDLPALSGLTGPVFFDHSMFISVSPHVIREAMRMAVAAAQRMGCEAKSGLNDGEIDL